MPEWGNAVISASVAAVVTAILSWVASLRRARAQRKLARRRLARIARRDVALVEEYFEIATDPEARSMLRDLGAEVEDLILSTEEVWPKLSEAVAGYRDALARFRRAPYLMFASDSDPKESAHPVIDAANAALSIAHLPPTRLEPYKYPEPGRG